MDEQQLRSEIEYARSVRFPTDNLEIKKSLLRDVYYPKINEEKILSVNCPEDKKEEHIQRVLETELYIEQLETEIIAEDSSWIRPENSIVDLVVHPLFSTAFEAAPNIVGGTGKFYQKLLINDVPVSSLSWPIGSIFMSVNPEDPSTGLGFGVWERIAQGKTLIGIDELDTDFDGPEKVGGEKAVTLLEAEMPTHTHLQLPHTHLLTGGRIDDTYAPYTAPDAANSDASVFQGGIEETTATNQPTGEGLPHNNLPPYFTVYIFKRVS